MIDLLAVVLGGFLLMVGTMHFVWPRYFESLIPPWLSRGRVLVLASGAAEALIGVGLLLENLRQPAGVAATALMAVYVLTHVDALMRSSREARRWLDRPLGAVARVVVNLGYLALATVVAVGG